ncbi:MAG: hypothetical protein HYT77_02455 [Deltaproteobacteria bacterium]|nr:hypothetical protein [Deltaproteobacteria bacterium]
MFSKRESEIHIWHVVSCFFSGHTYQEVGFREGHREYVCGRCGHPLLLTESQESPGKSFKKRVRYLCNFFGHKEVHKVSSRKGMTEYACRCGHSFLKKESDLKEVKHPAICFFVGHYIRFVEERFAKNEYLCRNCGHTFLFS